MKRRLSNDTSGPGEGTRRRRQPQISCNFCRSKKLKCDRGQPCSNCTARGIPCDGQSLPAVSRSLGPRQVRSLFNTVWPVQLSENNCFCPTVLPRTTMCSRDCAASKRQCLAHQEVLRVLLPTIHKRPLPADKFWIVLMIWTTTTEANLR